jgi:hypothetical protein
MVPAQPAVTNSEAVDKAHEALRQKMMELDAEKAARPAPAPATTAAVAAPAAAAATTGTAPAENKNWDAAIAAAVTQANTESSQSRKMDQQDWAAQTRETQSAPSAAARKQSSQSASQPKAVTDKRVAALPALQGPPSGLSASQDQRLRALNQEYMADRISSEQYHVQRAQIMAQP